MWKFNKGKKWIYNTSIDIFMTKRPQEKILMTSLFLFKVTFIHQNKIIFYFDEVSN